MRHEPGRPEFEKYVAQRAVSDAEWEPWADQRQDMWSAYNWVRDYEAQFGSLARLGTEGSREAIRTLRHLRYELGEARRVVFDRAIPRTTELAVNPNTVPHAIEVPSPPFRDLSQAWSWIRAELESPAAGSFREHHPRPLTLYLAPRTSFSPGFKSEIPWAADNPMLARIRDRVPFYYIGIEAEVAAFRLHNERSPEYVAPDFKEAFRTGVLPLFGIPGPSEPRQIAESEVECVTERLALLAVWGGWLSVLTDHAWTRADCIRHILTDEVPRLPRMRVRRTQFGAVAEVYTQITRAIWSEMFHAIKALVDRGDLRKKTASSADLELVQFVEQRPRRRKEWSLSIMLKAWNEAHPDARFESRGALDQEYRRAKQRLAEALNDMEGARHGE